MTIEIREFDTAKSAISFLEEMAFGEERYVFRGQGNTAFRLETTYARFRNEPLTEKDNLDELIRKFRVGLVKINNDPIDGGNKQDWLEYARHYGVPTPCLDFTYSPYIALFFAFSGMKGSVDGEDSVMISAINLTHLAHAWARQNFDPQSRPREFNQCFNGFFQPQINFFTHAYPMNTLQFIPFPAKCNVRMQRQQGAFVYDTLAYPLTDRVDPSLCSHDLEDFIQNIRESDLARPGSSTPPLPATMTKVHIKKKCITDVFVRLELMGITGAFLLTDAEGVVLDLFNQYHYKSKTYYLRDVSFE